MTTLPIENTGAPNSKRDIQERGNNLVQAMWAHRSENLIEVYRTCSEQEAWNTFTTMLAGGQLRLDMKQLAPSNEQVVQQVGNNETWFQKGEDPRLLMLKKLGINPTPPKPRDVVEYSRLPTQLKLTGLRIKVGVNVKYVEKGSGLSFEGLGIIVQIGTPLAWVVINPDV